MSDCCGDADDRSACAGPSRQLTIRWQRLVTDAGETCSRCSHTESAVAEAGETLGRALAPMGIGVVVDMRPLDAATFREAPGESNRIWVDDRPLEDWLTATVGTSACCDACGDAECRTMEIGGSTHEAIPAEAIVRAGLLAAADLLART